MSNNEATLVLKAKDLATIEVRRVTEEMRRASRESIENTKSANRIAQDSARATSRIQIDAARSAQRVVEQGAKSAAFAARQAESAFNQARQAALGFVAAYASFNGLRALVGITDQYANLQAKIRIATKSQEEFNTADRQTYEIAQRTFTSLEATVTLYARLTASLEKYGVSQNRVAGLTETINKSLTVSGATAAESESAIIQLSQAFGAGALRGQEFNSVNEAAPLLMQKLADALGVPRGALKGLAAEGALTTEVLVAAFEEQAASISASFDEIPLTTTRALTQMQNAGTVAFGKLFGDGNLALAEFISFFISGVEQLPRTADIVVSEIVGFFQFLWISLQTNFALIIPYAQKAWDGIKNGAEVGAEAVALVYALAVDSIQKGFAGVLRSTGEGLTAIGSAAGPALTKLATLIEENASRVQTLTAEIKVSDAARKQATEVINANIDAILAEGKAQLVHVDAAIKGAYASTQAAESAVKEGDGHRKTAKELLAEALARGGNTKATNAAKAAAKNLLDIELEMINTRARLIESEEKETAAKDAARKAIEGIIPAIEKAYELDGLTIEQRRIAEAGTKAEAYALKILADEKVKLLGLSPEVQSAIVAEAKARGQALEAAQIQTEAATEANKKAAEEYKRQWEQAFDDIVDAALRGGDSLKNVVKDYLRNIVAQFAKKIILNIITRYSSQGQPGKAGKDGSSSSSSGSSENNLINFAAGAVGVSDAYRSGSPLSGAVSGAQAGAAIGSIFPVIGTAIGSIVGAIVGGFAGLFGGPSKPDLRLGAAGVTRKPEQSFNTAFGAQQIGVRGGTDTAQFVNLVTEFDKTIAGIVGNFSNGQDQLDAIKNRLRTWSVDLKGDAITTEAVLGSRFNAILSTFSADIQAFVGTLGTVEERAQRLQDAAFIQGASKASILANTFNDLARILTDNQKAGESIAQTYERVSASVEILRAALAISGVTVKQTGDEFIKFAADIATAAGGTQQAAQLWETYFNTFYTGEERALKAVEIANKRRAEALAGLGLDANTTAEQFREAFERLLPTLTPEQIVQWLRAGEAIGAAADAQDAYNAVLTEGGEKLRGLADSLRTIEQQIDAGFTELERSGFTDFERSLLSINDNLQATTASLLEQRAAAVAAGASAQTLARYDLALGRAQLLAAAQAAAAIEKLRKAARSLIDQLYGKGAKQFSDSGTQAFQDIGDAAQSMYESQLNSIKTIQDYLDGQLLGGTSTLTPVQQFDEAQRQFNAAIIAGNAQEATRLADVLLKLGQGRFASSQPYTDLEATVRAALQGLLGSIGQPVGPTGTVGTGGQGSPEEFDAAARENRLELALQLSEIVRDLLLATGDSLSEVAASIGLNMTALVTDLGVNLTDLSVGTASSLATIAQSLGVELSELAENVGVDLGDLSDSQSLINGALKAAIDKLPVGQRDALKELLTDVEEAARTGGPDEINRAIGALETRVNLIGGATASALAPFFTGVNPVDPLNSIDSAVRALYQPGSLLDQINAGIAELVRRTTLPQPETAPPIAPAGNNAVYVPSAVVPGRSSFTATPANTEGTAQVVEQLKRTVARLESLEATVRSGTTQQVRATVGVGETIVSATDKRQPVKPKLVMSE